MLLRSGRGGPAHCSAPARLLAGFSGSRALRSIREAWSPRSARTTLRRAGGDRVPRCTPRPGPRTAARGGRAISTVAGEIAVLDATAQAELVRTGEVTAGRARRGRHRAHRGAQPDAQRGRHPDVRRARSTPPARADRPVRRRAVPPQGPRDRDARACASREGSRVPARQRLDLRLRAGGAAAARRAVVARQDEHPRVRDGAGVRAAAVRPDPQPVGPRPLDQRLERRLRGRGRVRHGAAGARQRPRRIDPLPGVGLRPVRAQAHPRPQPARPRVRRRRAAAGRSSTR